MSDLVSQNLNMIFKTPKGETVHALKDVNFTLKKGELLTVLGPSGCGKTTLLNITAGFLRPTSGQITLGNNEINGPGVERGMVFQQGALFEWLTVAENVNFGLRMKKENPIETAKKVYTETNIAKKPVSVVSLAYHNLKALNIPLDSRILIVGAGVTNVNMSRFLRKHGFTNYNVFNRTFEKAEKLANDLNGTAHRLSDLAKFDKGFDIIITCTGSENHILTEEIYSSLLQGESSRKVVIDIAIPQDLSPAIINKHNVTHISVEVLQKIS